jgi:twinkle protein
MLNWNPEAILCLCSNETDVEVLSQAGYTAILAPEQDDFSLLPKAEHYIVFANGKTGEIAKSLAGACEPWRISVNHHAHQDLSHAAEAGGLDLVRRILLNGTSLFHDEVHPFADVVKPESVPNYPTWWKFLHQHLRWTRPLCVSCGPYAGGKSALALMLACDFADKAGRKLDATASICAWEDAGWRVRRNIERFAATREALDECKGVEWRIKDLLRRVSRITRRPNDLRSIDWYLERCELLVKRENCRFFIFDPWSQHDEMRERNDTETQYINKMLRDMREFVDVHHVIMIVVTHISAKSYDEEGGIRPFRVAQASGSSHFGRMADRGLCVARTKGLPSAHGENRMIIWFDKAKDEESMGEPGGIAVRFDRDAMNIELDPAASHDFREAWGL